jgi:MFS transporter, DHA2 family, multidrug resistance protein
VQAGNLRYSAMVNSLSHALTARGSSTTQALHQAQGLIYQTVQRQASMLSFIDDFWIMAMICLGVIPLLFLMKKIRPGKAPAAVH